MPYLLGVASTLVGRTSLVVPTNLAGTCSGARCTGVSCYFAYAALCIDCYVAIKLRHGACYLHSAHVDVLLHSLLFQYQSYLTADEGAVQMSVHCALVE